MEPVPKTRQRKGQATIRQVAEVAGVGVGTVSRVINGSDNVRAQTRERVLEAIETLRFRPSAAARALSKGRTSTIAITAPHLTRPSVVERLRGVIDSLAASSYDISLATVERPEQRERRLRDVCDRNRPDGLIVISLTPTHEESRRLQSIHLPTVFVDAKAPDFPSVDIDDVAGGRLATEHLLALGHTRIAFLGDIPEEGFHFTSSNDRHQGYRDALAAAGVAVDDRLTDRGEHSRQVAIEVATRLLALRPRPTAIFASSDTQALGVLEAARRLGVRVPKDLSVVGFDDLEAAALVGLSTVRQPLFQSGQEAASLLLRRMSDDADDPANIPPMLLPLELVQRHTTGPPPARAPKHRPVQR